MGARHPPGFACPRDTFQGLADTFTSCNNAKYVPGATRCGSRSLFPRGCLFEPHFLRKKRCVRNHEPVAANQQRPMARGFTGRKLLHALRRQQPQRAPRQWGSCGGDQPLPSIREPPPLRPGSPRGTELSGAARLTHAAAPRCLHSSWPGASQVGNIRPSPTEDALRAPG